MNIIFTVGYYPVYISNVDSKFVDKLLEAVRVEKDWKIDKYYATDSQSTEVIIAKEVPLTQGQHQAILDEKLRAEAIKAADPVTE